MKTSGAKNLYLKLMCTAALLAGCVASTGQNAHAAVKSLDGGKVKTSTAGSKSGKSGKSLKFFHPDPKDPSNQFEPGEVVVLNAPKSFVSDVSGDGYKVLESQDLGSLGLSMIRLKIAPGKSVPEAVRDLSRKFPGAIIDANHTFGAQAKRVHARAAMGWKSASAKCGTGIRIGMIDSGVDTSHPALKGQKVIFRSFHRKGRRPGPKVHGTAIASMLVGTPKWGGLLPGAKLLAASMFETKKSGKKVGTSVGMLRSLNWLAKARVDAINLSVAGSDNKTLRHAFGIAKRLKLVLIAAAGNWGRSDKPAYPAAYKDVVAVTAVNSKGKVYSHANQGKYIDFAAPGVRIYAAVPGGGKVMSGTSFATPYITAMVSTERVFGGNSTRSRQIKQLRRHSKDLGRSGKDSVYGYGFVRLQPKCK
jgi:subtilisin family serine protease